MKFASLCPTPDAGLRATLQQIPAVPVSAPRCLLLGPARSGKTSLLFNYAYHAASRGATVLFVSSKHKLALTPPLLPPGVERTDPAFTRIHMKYIHNLHELQKLGACLHLLPHAPSAVVVDELPTLIAATSSDGRRASDAELTRAMALLVDGLESLGRQHGIEIELLLSDECGEGGTQSQHHHMLARWCPLILRIRGLSDGVFSLELASVMAAAPLDPCLPNLHMHYRLTGSSIRTETILCEGKPWFPRTTVGIG